MDSSLTETLDELVLTDILLEEGVVSPEDWKELREAALQRAERN